MSKRASKSKPAIVDVDMATVSQVLERARTALSGEDYECINNLVQTLIELSRLVRERGTTIARLRRLFGLACSEKTADVLGDAADAHGSAAQSDTCCDQDESGETKLPDSTACASASNDTATTIDAGGKPKRFRKGHGRIAASHYATPSRICVEHESLHSGDVCPGCARGKLYQLAPAQHVRIVGQAVLAAERFDIGRLRCGACGMVFTARPPKEALGPKYDDSAAAIMALMRYDMGMPLNRLDRFQRNLGTPVPASTQWEVVRDRSPALKPVYDELRRRGAQGRVLHNDDTMVRILSLMGKRRAELLVAGELPDPDRTGLFTTGIVSITDEGPIALFFSGRKHAGENLAALLDERNHALAAPIHMCDGLDRNLPVDHDVLPSNCLAHGRRHVVDEVENFPDECRHLLEALRDVFKNEATCRKQGLSGQQRLEFHQRESGPIMASLETWMHAQLDDQRIEPNSGLGGALRYLIKRWTRLTLFLRVPDAPLENNICERTLKMAIRLRNGSLFYRSERGAEVGDLYMALIYTAELHGQNPFDYLLALLKHPTEVAADPSAWLPWTYQATLARASPPTTGEAA